MIRWLVATFVWAGLLLAHGGGTLPEVVDQRGRCLTQCQVHGTESSFDRVEVLYGLLAVPSEKWANFPNSNSYWQGGCMLGPKRQALVLYCPECRLIEAEFDRLRLEQRRTAKAEERGWVE